MREAKLMDTPAKMNRMVSVLQDIWGKAIGLDPSEVDIHTSFLELGADSLCLLQVSQAIRNRLDFKLPFRMMLDEYTTVHDLAAHILQSAPDHRLFAEEISQETQADTAQAAPIGDGFRYGEADDSSASQTGAQSSPPVPELAANLSPQTVAVAASLPQHQAPVRMEDASRAALPGNGLEQLLSQQLQIIRQQLEVLQQRQSNRAPVAAANTRSVATPAQPVESSSNVSAGQTSPHADARPATFANRSVEKADARTSPDKASSAGAEPTATARKIEPETFVPYRSLKSGLGGDLLPQQREHLAALIERLTRRTRGSKQHTQDYRPYLADSRTVAGFRTLWKEMHYPLVVERGEGSRVWDVDGNEYIDITSGFGALLFGHSPSFILDALREQTKFGLQIGGRSTSTGKAAKLLCEMTGVERVQFCNSGTEAIMAALRLARVATRRERVALFTGSYHGTFDGVMVRGQRTAEGALKTLPLAPGIPEHMIGNVLLLDMNDADCLEQLKRHAHELAAIMIEPRQSRRPDLDLGVFLHDLRRVADESGAALIFDEVVTGFRFHAGGSRALFGVQADLITYGKAIAGGLPVAAVGGKAAYMDAIDGGIWNYGDASYPQAETTFVAGTYFMHPLLMPVVYEVLQYINSHGLALQEQMRWHTQRLTSTLNAYFEKHNFPMRVAHFESLFRFFFAREVKYADLFYYHLLEKGIFVCETRGCILSTAHTDEDIDGIIKAVRESVTEMRAGGFLPELPTIPPPDAADKLPESFGSPSRNMPAAPSAASSAATLEDRRGEAVEDAALTLPVTEAQKGIWALAQLSEDAARAYHQSFNVSIKGDFDIERMRVAVQRVVNRHDALRTTFSHDGERQYVHAEMPVEVSVQDYSQLAGDERETEVARRLRDEVERPFNLVDGPLVRAAILKLEENNHLLVMTIHHIITDGWSNSVIQRDLAALYAAAQANVPETLPRPMQFRDYVLKHASESSAEFAAAEAYWLNRFASSVPAALELPTDRPRSTLKTFAGGRHSFTLDAALYGALKRLSAQNGSTLLMTLLAGYNTLLHKLTRQEDIVIGLHLAGQLTEDGHDLVGHCVNLLPFRSRLKSDATFREYLSGVKQSVLEVHKHQNYSLNRLIKKLNLPRDPARLPLVTVTFNMDVAADLTGMVEPDKKQSAEGSPNGTRASVATGDVPPQIDITPNPPGFLQWDMSLNVIDSGRGGVAEFDYNSDLFDLQTIRRWAEDYEALLRAIVQRADARLGELHETIDRIEKQQLSRKRDEFKQNFKNIKRKAIHG